VCGQVGGALQDCTYRLIVSVRQQGGEPGRGIDEDEGDEAVSSSGAHIAGVLAIGLLEIRDGVCCPHRVLPQHLHDFVVVANVLDVHHACPTEMNRCGTSSASHTFLLPM